MIVDDEMAYSGRAGSHELFVVALTFHKIVTVDVEPGTPSGAAQLGLKTDDRAPTAGFGSEKGRHRRTTVFVDKSSGVLVVSVTSTRACPRSSGASGAVRLVLSNEAGQGTLLPRIPVLLTE